MGLVVRIILSIIIFGLLFFSGIMVLVYNPNPLPEQKTLLAIAQVSLFASILFLASIPIITHFRVRKLYLVIIGIILLSATIISLYMVGNVSKQKKETDIQKLAQDFTILVPELTPDWGSSIEIPSNKSLGINYSFGDGDRSIEIDEWKSQGGVECSVSVFTSTVGGFKLYANEKDLGVNCETFELNGNKAVYSFVKQTSYTVQVIVWNQSGTRVHMDVVGVPKEEVIKIAKSFHEQ